MTQSVSPLRQRNVLRRPAVHHVLHLDRGWRDADDFVAPVHDLALAGDKNFFALDEKNLLRLTHSAGEAIELQRNWGRGWNRRRSIDYLFRLIRRSGTSRYRDRHRVRLRHKNIPA